MNKKFKSVLIRFIKAFLFGAFSGGAAIVGVIYKNTLTWPDFISASAILLLACLIGGINGVLMAGQKFVSWKE